MIVTMICVRDRTVLDDKANPGKLDIKRRGPCILFIRLPIIGTRDLFNISYSRELYLVSKFLYFEEIVRVKMAVCFEMLVSET